ncbi:4-hydroxy-tetrahydrodipicolinate reductase [soil metagenome]
MIKVAVLGASGRMGQEVVAAVLAEDDLELTEEVDIGLSSLEALVENGVQVAVDFTNAGGAAENIPWCMKNGIHIVVGSSGIPPSVIAEITELAPKCEGHVLIAPNFAIGAVLAMKFAEMAAAWMPDAEIIELHHSGKMDSPSGTALQTADAILKGRRSAPAERPGTPKENIPGARGSSREDVHIHSVRLPGLVAHQEVLFGGPGQILTIRHDSIDRKSFMPGVIVGIREIARHPGLTIGLEHYLGL